MTADVTTPRDAAGDAAGDTAEDAPFRADPTWTVAGVLRRLAAPSALAGLGLYAAAGGHVIASLVHLSHGWRITVFFLVAAELLTLATVPALLPATARRRATDAMLLVGVGLWVAWGTGLL